MKVILEKDIPKLGKKGDMKEVSDGFARNYLLKNGLAARADANAVNIWEQQQLIREQKEAQQKEKYGELAKKLNELQCDAALKVGKDGSVFGSIGIPIICELLRARGIQIDKSQVELPHPIKTIGDHRVPIKLNRDTKAAVTIRVTQEK